MELQILVSKKGTKVVTAHQLHQALRLTDYKYNQDVLYWLNDVYAFDDGVHQPVEMKDYAKRSFQYTKLQDYYLSIELAIHIALRTNSPTKLFYAKYLIAINKQDNSKFSKTTNTTSEKTISNNVVSTATPLPYGIQLGLW